jgi:hypothetical protein
LHVVGGQVFEAAEFVHAGVPVQSARQLETFQPYSHSMAS